MATTSPAYRKLHRGTLARDKTVQTLAPDDWQSVLTQRGFAAMLAHWYQQIEAGRADGALIESYLHGHRLAERLVTLAGSEGDRRAGLPGP